MKVNVMRVQIVPQHIHTLKTNGVLQKTTREVKFCGLERQGVTVLPGLLNKGEAKKNGQPPFQAHEMSEEIPA